MTDHFARPAGAASSARLAELHRLCDRDYGKGQAEQAAAQPFPPYTPFATAVEPSDLAVAIRIAQKMLARYGDTSDFDVFDYAQAHGGLAEALRILLRALVTESACPNCGRTFEDCTCTGILPGGGQ
jgi:hypothetical protein